MYPGTLNSHQGLDVAVRAFALIAKQAPHAEFHIYGEGPERQPLQDLIRSLRLENRVLIRGLIPSEQIALVMQEADLGIVPKRADSFGNEAFSTKTLEFMLLGVPLLISDTRVDRYYFDDSVVKFFRSGSDQDLARSMLDLINSSVQRKRLVDNADVFISRFSWGEKKIEYLDLVDRLIGNKSGRHTAQ